MNLVPTNRIELDERFKNSGLYESFYFRGDSVDGKYSFWLKHNFIRFSNSHEVRLDNVFLLFSYQDQKVSKWYQSKTIPLIDFYKLVERSNRSWDEFKFDFSKKGYMALSSNKLTGSIQIDDKMVTWDLHLKKSKQSYFHFNKKWFYTAFFPKKKILTNDICLSFFGNIETPTLKISQCELIGMNGHNWGKEHAHIYAYGNCNRFEGFKPGEIYFDGFSAKIKIASLTSPFLSCCSLKVGNKFFHFNSVLRSFNHQVYKLKLKYWQVTFFNKEHRLEIILSGEKSLWADLEYDHPNKKKSTVYNTKNATGEFYLKTRNGQLINHFKSTWVELETLAPP